MINVRDVEFVVYVRGYLYVDGTDLCMNKLNNFYFDLLKDKKIHEERSDTQKKHQMK